MNILKIVFNTRMNILELFIKCSSCIFFLCFNTQSISKGEWDEPFHAMFQLQGNWQLFVQRSSTLISLSGITREHKWAWAINHASSYRFNKIQGISAQTKHVHIVHSGNSLHNGIKRMLYIFRRFYRPLC